MNTLTLRFTYLGQLLAWVLLLVWIFGQLSFQKNVHLLHCFHIGEPFRPAISFITIFNHGCAFSRSIISVAAVIKRSLNTFFGFFSYFSFTIMHNYIIKTRLAKERNQNNVFNYWFKLSKQRLNLKSIKIRLLFDLS